MDTGVILPVEQVEALIHVVRGQRVILDEDVAALYGVETSQLVRAVQRNVDRFPEDFMFRLTKDEFERVWRELGRLGRRGGRRVEPYAFTEHGVAMLSGVLRSDRAVSVNIQIVRAFVHMRSSLVAQGQMGRRLDELEAKYDSQFSVVFEAIRQLMLPPNPPRRHPIGFTRPRDGSTE